MNLTDATDHGAVLSVPADRSATVAPAREHYSSCQGFKRASHCSNFSYQDT